MLKKELSLEKTLGLIFLVFVLSITLTLKIGGASSLPELVEKDGYCKTVYNENWDYNENKQLCYSFSEEEKQEQPFTQQEFRNVCPKNSFLSLRFYSDCFHKGEARNSP